MSESVSIQSRAYALLAAPFSVYFRVKAKYVYVYVGDGKIWGIVIRNSF